MNYPKPAIFEPEVFETVVYVSVPQYDFAHVITKESLFHNVRFANLLGNLNEDDVELIGASETGHLELAREPIIIRVQNRSNVPTQALILASVGTAANFGNPANIVLLNPDEPYYLTMSRIANKPINVGLINVKIIHSDKANTTVFRSMTLNYKRIDAFGQQSTINLRTPFDPRQFDTSNSSVNNIIHRLDIDSYYECIVPGNTTIRFDFYPLVRSAALSDNELIIRRSERVLARMEAKAKYREERMRAREQKAEARRNRR